MPRSKKIKVLRRSGTANIPRSSLGFLPTVSHRSLIVSSPTNEAMSANAMCSGIGRAQSSSLFANHESRTPSAAPRVALPAAAPLRGVTMNAPVGPLRSFLRPPKSGHCFGRNELVWDGLKLKLGARVTATIEPDANWGGMWRVRLGRRLSDMANLSRAKDAAISIVLRGLNANS
jgi:hypothetical protein